MTPLQVTCAIIEHEGKVLAARRGPGMQMPGCWEFPGGKLRPSEPPEQCIVREIREELAIEIRPLSRLEPSTHHYPRISITLLPFVCEFVSGSIQLADHSEARWCGPAELDGLQWCEADMPVLKAYLKERNP
jgi:8-oxo-dGTP diphosphatase